MADWVSFFSFGTNLFGSASNIGPAASPLWCSASHHLSLNPLETFLRESDTRKCLWKKENAVEMLAMSRNNQCETRFELFIMSTAAIFRTQHDPALLFLKTRQTIRYNCVIVSVFLLLYLRWSLMKTGYCFTSFDLYSVILFVNCTWSEFVWYFISRTVCKAFKYLLLAFFVYETIRS